MTSPSDPSGAGHASRRRSWLRPRLDWLLVFVPVAIALRFLPSIENPTALFVVACAAGEELTRMEAEEGAHAPWSLGKSGAILLGATAFVALLSEFLVGAIESARASLGLTEVFVGVIVVAIIGNAAEHSSAVLMALRNKMDISIGIAVGSSLQIALFVAPVLVFASYLFGRPMNFEFTVPEVVPAGAH